MRREPSLLLALALILLGAIVLMLACGISLGVSW
jgi:hypothetical protein